VDMVAICVFLNYKSTFCSNVNDLLGKMISGGMVGTWLKYRTCDPNFAGLTPIPCLRTRKSHFTLITKSVG
jgi:hypothetical protein